MCGLEIDVDEGRISKIRGDRLDPLSAGHLCVKGLALRDLHEDPDRLRRPLRRVGRDFAEVSWEEALDAAATGLRAVQQRHGRHSVAVFQGNPTVHSYSHLLAAQVLVRALGSGSLYSATSLDQLPQMLAGLLMFGHQLLMPVPDLERTELLLVLGANPMASNGSLLGAPGFARRMRALRERGGRLVVVDPRRTETAALADEHLAIRPGTDALLLLAMLHVVFAEDLGRPGRLAAFTDGLDTVRARAAPYPPSAVAEATGLAPDRIAQLARAFARARRAVAYGRVGICTQEFGSLAAWLVNVLNAVTGNLDEPGGAMFTRPAVDLLGIADRLGQRGHLGRRRSRVRGLASFSGEYPAATLAEEMETPGPGQIRGLLTSAGNPVLSTPNGARLERALPGLELMVAIDVYVNETTRHAHVILPPTFGLERDHYDLALHLFGVRNTARWSPPVLAPSPGARGDWDVLLDLAGRLARLPPRRSLRMALMAGALRRAGPRRALDLLLRTGPYGAGFLPGRRGLSLRALERAPHGVDLGPLERVLPERLRTPDRRIALAPEPLLADLARLEARRAAASAGGLVLVGRRDLRSNNSWMHNVPHLVAGADRCTLLMHPDDAAARELRTGQHVVLRSRTGSIVAPLQVSTDVRPGVVSLPHGWGHGRPGLRLAVAARHPGVSANDVTDDARVDVLSGNAAFNGVPVEVAAAD